MHCFSLSFIAKFRYHSECYCAWQNLNFRYALYFRYDNEINCTVKIIPLCFLFQTTSFCIIPIFSPLYSCILGIFGISHNWVGYISHLIAFVTLTFNFQAFSSQLLVLGYILLSSLSSFSHFLGFQTHPLRMTTQGMVGSASKP